MIACGGIVAHDGGSPSPTPSPSPTTNPLPSPTPTPSPTTSTSPPSPPSPISCVETHDGVAISVTTIEGVTVACTSPTFIAGEYDVDGRIAEAKTDRILVDTCGPAADCAGPIDFVVAASAPGLDLSRMPLGSFVHVHAAFHRPSGCTTSVVVTSLDAWEGEKNPVDVGGHVYFVASDGSIDVPTLPWSITLQPNHCKPSLPSCSHVAADDYDLVFQITPGASTDLPMGETAFLLGSDPAHALFARNLRAFTNGTCDDTTNWAFWAALSPATGL